MAIIESDIVYAKKLLSSGEVVAVPTETVYGLAADAYNSNAVLKLFAIKKRPSFDPIIVHTASIDRIFEFVTRFSDNAMELAQKFWPGPLTLLLDKKKIIPDIVTSGSSKVGVRIPRHDVALSLLNQIPFPLAMPSANPFGYVSPTSPNHVQDQLGNQVPYILDGGICSIGIESTIVGFRNDKPVIYRLGGISVEEIERIFGTVRVQTTFQNCKIISPGSMKSHYSPKKKLVVGDIDAMIKKYADKKIGVLVFDKYQEDKVYHQVMLAPDGSLETAAKNLFGSMRLLDSLPIDIILTSLVKNEGIGKAINDRLKKASV